MGEWAYSLLQLEQPENAKDNEIDGNDVIQHFRENKNADSSD